MPSGSTFLVCMVICQGASNCYVDIYVTSTCYLKNANYSNMGACSNFTIGLIAVNLIIFFSSYLS